jgi:site-specific DNA recombinase
LRAITDPSGLDAYGNPSKIGTTLALDPIQAPIVREIFERFVAGASWAAIARELNSRGIASAGSTWKRTTRRHSGWMGNGVRLILLNPLYTGHSNASPLDSRRIRVPLLLCHRLTYAPGFL